MNTFKHLTLMAVILLGVQGLGASVQEEDTPEKPKTPAAEQVDKVVDSSSKSSGEADKTKDQDASKGKKKTCQIL